ncbi:unnamed protein product [Lupinus luteus]|uniref:Uncharacterized protein n=1 Tax=Lupinus luteus TaxID=3873 RepID=A0AAV1WBZ0_LUPLU
MNLPVCSGCSSLGFGAMEELGPFRVNNEGALYANVTKVKYEWVHYNVVISK